MKSDVQIFYVKNTPQVRKVREYFAKNGVRYSEKCLEREALTYEQLIEILQNSFRGVEEILSGRSAKVKKLIKEGIFIERLSIKQLHWLIQRHPDLLVNLIIVGRGRTLIGYQEEEMAGFLPREQKRQIFLESLKRAKILEADKQIV
ncbi:hypothetical protein B4064_1690 [Caldibacillus thermoamylovorans]|jgi:Spx/MgsR family transcriptional regulator|uniref:Arsenate reductase n=1 Tax=Caldibacillus thermoamylovorans TaxID=35841 RepID=A0A0D0F8X5_9BACI|nr:MULTISPECIES: ArsC/Spx/MgsR family protein [Bacillaceae]KIO66924.1 hypothetical protein B4166_2469 [Caldibacillus thermoamylovorans]KIO67892.1 hypothetical protein B4065_1797 [Caldibacillus thermoamylovorans]KIO68534.1 hypothetical protein B4064_1690 [Caldibacillus thermoamylovorans]KIO73906.1 hypothetical protein B4167_1739 [Caldibacillus thermoamylovorans]MCB7070898.1 hypothetical protein [Caldibacillus sp. 210928-DFI.2.22]